MALIIKPLFKKDKIIWNDKKSEVELEEKKPQKNIKYIEIEKIITIITLILVGVIICKLSKF